MLCLDIRNISTASQCLLTVFIFVSHVIMVAMVTHQAAVLGLQHFRGASLSVQRVKGLDPQC